MVDDEKRSIGRIERNVKENEGKIIKGIKKRIKSKRKIDKIKEENKRKGIEKMEERDKIGIFWDGWNRSKRKGRSISRYKGLKG